MLQWAIVYAVVGFAAGWVAWSMFMPRQLKAKLWGRVKLRR